MRSRTPLAFKTALEHRLRVEAERVSFTTATTCLLFAASSRRFVAYR
jgi:hypothetical protein